MTQKPKLLHEELTGVILGGFFTVYNAHGYGFLEQVYSNSMSLELRTRGLHVEREVAVEVQYLGQPVGHYRLDMVVNHLVVVEMKAGPAITEAHSRQLYNYLRCAGLQVGLLLLCGPKPEIKRLIIESGSAGSASSASSA